MDIHGTVAHGIFAVCGEFELDRRSPCLDERLQVEPCGKKVYEIATSVHETIANPDFELSISPPALSCTIPVFHLLFQLLSSLSPLFALEKV